MSVLPNVIGGGSARRCWRIFAGSLMGFGMVTASFAIAEQPAVQRSVAAASGYPADVSFNCQFNTGSFAAACSPGDIVSGPGPALFLVHNVVCEAVLPVGQTLVARVRMSRGYLSIAPARIYSDISPTTGKPDDDVLQASQYAYAMHDLTGSPMTITVTRSSSIGRGTATIWFNGLLNPASF